MTGGEVQIRFTSTDYPIINSESISIPLNATPEQLKSLVEGLVQSKLGQGSESKSSGIRLVIVNLETILTWKHGS